MRSGKPLVALRQSGRAERHCFRAQQRARLPPLASPKLRLNVSFCLDEDIHERPVVEVTRVKIGRYAPLVERAAFLDLLGERLEQVVALNAADDLLFVVK